MPADRTDAVSTGRATRLGFSMSGEADWAIAITPVVAVLWLASIVGLMIEQQVAALPPRSPTRAEVIASTPAAQAHWRRTYALLQRRLDAWQPRPPEQAAVWSTRTGQICGLVDQWHTGLDYMTRFYTVGDRVLFKDDDLRLYMREWSRCVVDPWVVLHPAAWTRASAKAVPAGTSGPRFASSLDGGEPVQD